MALLCCSSALQAQEQATITSNGDGSTGVSVKHSIRPLADVLRAIEQKYLTPLTFEEAPFESHMDLIPYSINLPDGSPSQRWALPHVDFSFTIPTAATMEVAVQTALTAYGSQGLPGIYGMAQGSGRIRVFPKEIRDSSGRMRAVSPIMDYPVTLPLATRGSVETMELIASIITRESGVKVESLNVPFLSGDTLTTSADGEPARDVINDLERIYHVPFTYQCLYEPWLKTYYVNVKAVAPPNPAGPPAVHGPRRPAPRTGPGGNPWFTNK